MIVRHILIACLLLCCSGCTIFGRTVYVESRRPMIPTPERPQLVQLPSDAELAEMDAEALKSAYRTAVTNMESVGTWGMRYESVVAKYNELAKAANIKNGYVLPDEEPETEPTE